MTLPMTVSQSVGIAIFIVVLATYLVCFRKD